MALTVARRIVGLLVAATVALSAAVGGRAVLWCTIMHQPVERCCCPADEHRPDDVPAFTTTGCCESKVTPALADAREARSVEAPLAAVALAASTSLPAPADVPAGRLASGGREHGARAGPRLGLYVVHRALLI